MGGADGLEAGTTPPAASTWLSLTIAMSLRPNRWFTPPPQRTAYFCSARQSGSVLRVSSTRRLGAVERLDPARGGGGDAGEVGGEVERGALGGEQAAGRAGDAHDDVTGGDAGPSGTRSVIATSSPSTTAKTRAATPRPATTPGSRAAKSAAPRASAGMVAVAGDVVGSARQVLLERRRRCRRRPRVGSRPASAARRAGRRGRSSYGVGFMRTAPSDGGAGVNRPRCRTRPRVASKWPDQRASSRSGKSSRQCEPRVSSRSAGRLGERRADRDQVGRLPGAGADLAGLVRERGQLVERVREPRRRAEHAGLLGHHRLERRSGCRRRPSPAGRSSGAGVGVRPELVGQHLRDPPREDEALEQGVGGEPVGAVHAGAGDLAGGVEAGYAGTAPEVGGHAPGRVVARRRDRDQLGHRVDPVLAAGRQDRREPLLPELRGRDGGRRATCAGGRSRASAG